MDLANGPRDTGTEKYQDGYSLREESEDEGRVSLSCEGQNEIELANGRE